MEKPYEDFEVKDYLKDKSFLLWRLFNNDESEIFWNSFAERYSGQKENLEKAIGIIDSLSLGSAEISPQEQEEIDDIFYRTREMLIRRRRNSRRLVRYISAAACIAAICTLAVFYPFGQKSTNNFIAESVSDSAAKGIKLVLGEKDIISFENNTDIIINKDGRIKIAVNQHDTTSLMKEALKRQQVKLIVPEGRKSSLILSDGTRIWINAGSSVMFPTVFTDNKRRISLIEGEAYLEVTPDKKRPFIVNTSFGEVKVLGTRFNISDYRADAVKSVVLAEGLVEVKMAESKGLLLKPNQMLSVASDTYDIKQVDTYDHICWKDGLIQFSNESLETIMLKLSRYYGMEFSCEESLKQKACTGKLVLFDNVTDVLETLSDIFHIQYRIENSKVELFNN
ncbi:MAG TPA: FecR domain-containing protein [Bacteroidales bacterium]|nr:FecR domain-containing protein [Bacteroidales bacterium]HPT11094.1 FecR domain-containing protein [Bacteroidales bacterium]